MEIEYKFNYRFNPKSNRLENYDYSSIGLYFITICTKDREKYFGEVINGIMILNKIGKIIEEDIINLPNYYDYVEINDFVVMPNHIHFIIILKENNLEKEVLVQDVSEKHLYDNNVKNNYYQNISPNKGSIGNIIKLFKGYISKKINKLENEKYFGWQKNYYDRVIRNEEEFYKIKQYIKNNPIKWELDKENEMGIFM